MNWLTETGRSIRDTAKETTSYVAENALEKIRGVAGYDDNYEENEARDAEKAANDGRMDPGEKWDANGGWTGLAGDIAKATVLGPIGGLASGLFAGETDAIAETDLVDETATLESLEGPVNVAEAVTPVVEEVPLNVAKAVTPVPVEGLGLDDTDDDVLGIDGTTTETVAQLTQFEQESLKKQDELNRLQAEANRIAKEGVDNTEKIATYANI